MGLGERRARHEFETAELPRLEARIAEAAGGAVPIEVKWDTIMVEGEAAIFAEAWSAIYFEPLIAGLLSVGRDEMGKEAMRAGLRKIVVQNTKGCHYANAWAEFDDGVLTLDHEPLTNLTDGDDRTMRLVKVLEAGL